MRVAAPHAFAQRVWPAVPLMPAFVFLLAVLLLAGAIHIVTIVLIPRYAQSDGWSRLANAAGENSFAEVVQRAENAEPIPGLDPLFIHGACRLNLEESPAALLLSARERFWSLALYNSAGRVVFSLNDRTAVEGELDMLVVNAVQNAELKENPPPGVDQTIVVESPTDNLIALLRLYSPTASSRDEARAILGEAQCTPAWASPAGTSTSGD
jgi:uncharacterized membrane protein